MKLKLYCDAFNKGLIIDNIDPQTINFYGSTEGYDYKDEKSFNDISFRLLNSDNISELIESLRPLFTLNPNYVKFEDRVKLRTEFKDYELDKRPKIIIKFSNGSRGMINPPEFSFEN